MAEEPKPQPSQPPRHRPRLSELSRETTEDDLWDLDSEPATAKDEPKEQPGEGARHAEPADESPASSGTGESGGEADANGADAPSDRETEATEPAETGVGESGPPAADHATAESTQEPPESAENEASGATSPDPQPGEALLPPMGRRERIALGATGIVLLALALWWGFGQFADVPTTRLGADQPDLPVKGQHAEVADAETFWRAPVRSGPQRDIARAEVSFIPVIAITLDEGSGVLRAIYRDQTGSFVGDAINRSFENGRFVDSGSETAEFPATDGIETDGEFNGYRVGEDRWTVEILEGSATGTGGGRFTPLFTAPVSATRR